MAGRRVALTDRNDPKYIRWIAKQQPWHRDPDPVFAETGVMVRRGEDLLPLEFLDRVDRETREHMESYSPRDENGSKENYLRAWPLLDPAHLDHAVVQLAVHPALMDPISDYLGYRPAVGYATIFHYLLTDTPPSGHQMFHRDPGGYHLGRVIVYLNDVDMDGGPFCYIPGTHPFGPLAGIKPPILETNLGSYEREVRVTDEEMKQVLPDWKYYPGPKYTFIFADTKGFHKGVRPTKRDRVALIIGYNGIE